MATATRTPIPTPPPTNVVLTLSEREARVLRQVCHHIGGDSAETARGAMNNIRDALDAVGVESADEPLDRNYGTGIYFA